MISSLTHSHSLIHALAKGQNVDESVAGGARASGYYYIAAG